MSTQLLSFNVLYNKSKREVANINQDRVRSRNERAFTSAIESLEEQKEELEEKLQDCLSVVTKGEIVQVQRVVEIRASIRKVEDGIKDLTEVKDLFFSTTKTTRGRGRDIKIVNESDSVMPDTTEG